MINISLSTKQILKLMKNQYLELENSTIELNNDILILNCDGNIYNVTAINAQFLEHKIENKHVIDFVKNLICKHLNLEPNQVIYSKGAGEEIEFIIRFAPNCASQIVVCEARKAVRNVRFYSEDTENIKLNSQYIGIYRQLGQSFYYFRWFNE